MSAETSLLDAGTSTVAAVMATALPGSVAKRPVEINDADEFVHIVSHQRVSGLVAEALERGTVEVPDDARRRFDAAHLDALRTSLTLEVTSVRVSTLLDGAGIRHAILKGCATAHLDYPDPGQRIFGDVDVLIDRAGYADAVSTFERNGLCRAAPPVRVGWERRFGKDVIFTDDVGSEIDLHLALATGYFGLVASCSPLLDRTNAYAVGGRELPALDRVGRLIHAAIHTAATTPLRLGSAADVVAIAHGGVSLLGEVRRRSETLAVGALVARGITRTWSAFELEPTDLSAWAAARPASRDEERALAYYDRPTGEARWYSGVAALPWWRRPTYVAPMILPSRAYLASRHRTYGDHLATSVRRIRRPV